MSVLTTLALLVTAAIKPKPDLQTEMLQRELAIEHSLSLHWLGEAQRLIREKRELELERDMLRLHAIPRGGQQMAQYQQNASLLQQNAQLAQCNQYQQQHQQLAAQNGLQNYHQGLLGVQALNHEMFCNCVPSRAQVWAAQGNGD
jgi:hypothetical protein